MTAGARPFRERGNTATLEKGKVENGGHETTTTMKTNRQDGGQGNERGNE
jgi:hypothetical protein